MIFRLLFVLVVSLFSSQVFAADPPFYSHSKKGAIKGADPVAYFSLLPGDKAVIGSDDITYEWRGATWKFASEANRDLFSKDPEKYAPQFGGYCAYAVGLGFTNSILPNSWSIIDGKLYLNHNRFTKRRFLKKQDEAIAKATSNWPEVLKECEARDRCAEY